MASVPLTIERSPADPIEAIRTVVNATQPWSVALTLILSDVVALSAAAATSVGIWHVFDKRFSPVSYVALWPVLVAFVAAYAASNLYPSIGVSAVEEFRTVTIVTTVVYCVLGASTFMNRSAELYSRGIFLLSWVLALGAIPLCRAAFRRFASRHAAWGYPAVILGGGANGRIIIERLLRNSHLGLRPVAVLADESGGDGYIAGIPVVGGLDLARRLTDEAKVEYAIAVMADVSSGRLADVLQRYGQSFSHLLVVPDLPELFTLSVSAKDVAGMLCLEVQYQLFQTLPRVCKRAGDLVFTVATGIVIAPLIALLALLIRLDSDGPAFYRQRRVGRNGRHFRVWKFRSMAVDGDAILARHLAEDPRLRLEWERTQKLRDDPRITRVGRFLRKSSLDELPQVWNILRGEMSWVGPRPIVDEEVPRYGEYFDQYVKVVPGITGLWQVSGRSDITYGERVRLDCYYVRNWSVWLDVHILARTVSVVLGCRGAY